MTCATTLPSTRALVYTAAKPRGPVRKNTVSVEVAAPTVKRGFVTPKFLGLVRLNASVRWLRGVVGPTRKDGRTATDVFLTTTLHPLRVRTQTVASLNPVGAKTMTKPQGRTTPAHIPTEEARALAALEAANCAALARWYSARGNVKAARRKAVQLLAALAVLEGGAA